MKNWIKQLFRLEKSEIFKGTWQYTMYYKRSNIFSRFKVVKIE